MTIDEAIIYMRGYQNKLKTSVSLGLDKDIEAYDMAIDALKQVAEQNESCVYGNWGTNYINVSDAIDKEEEDEQKTNN